MVTPITSKIQMYDLYEMGAFGNRPRSWLSLESYEEDNFQGLVSLRYKQSASRFFRVAMTRPQLLSWVERCSARGGQRHLMHVTESPPHHQIIFQGEVCESPDHLWLSYSTKPGLTCREAMFSDLHHAKGLKAHILLKDALDAPSWDNLWELFTVWPDHVIEFSIFDFSLGILGWNTIFWEVRLY